MYNAVDVQKLLLIEHKVLEAMQADPDFDILNGELAIELQRIRVEALRKEWQRMEGGFCKSFKEQTEARIARTVPPRQPGRVLNVD